MRGHKRLHLALLSIMCVLVAVGTCLVLLKLASTTTERIDTSISVPEPEPIVRSANMRALFAGTTFWGRRTNSLARDSELNVAYPFSKLDTLERERYDAWISGLECPITDNGHNSYEEENLFKFNCDPDYLVEAKKYFTAFLLGNNHTDNQDGEVGLTTTRKYLEENKIQYFGTPKYSGNVASELVRDTKEASNCDIVVLPVRTSFDDGTIKETKIPFGFCSAHGVFGIPGSDYIENMKTYAEIVPTIAMPHMGAEYQSSHDQLRQNLFRRMIDYAGVESVIADHPHWVQDSEAYNGKLIVYSMGNFMFDQNWGGENSRSAAIEAEADIDIDGVDFEKWNELGEACLEDKISCFTKIKEANLPKLKITWTYDYHATTSEGDCITRLANETEQALVGERLRWSAIPDSMKIDR